MSFVQNIFNALVGVIVSGLMVLGLVPAPEVVLETNATIETTSATSTEEKPAQLSVETTTENENENKEKTPHQETEKNTPPPPTREEVSEQEKSEKIIERTEIVTTDTSDIPAEQEPNMTPVETPDATVPLLSFETNEATDTNTKTREALVNIFCRSNGIGPTNSIVGSGIIIDSRGVILTNAHVAQFILLENYPNEKSLDCTVRTGDPARPMYRAQLLYISPSWIEENATLITDQNPTGTGQFDFAFLYITEPIQETQTLPDSFPFVPPNTHRDLSLNEQVLVAGYPAGFLGSTEIEKNLYGASSYVYVEELFTFSTSTIDLVALSGSVVSQRGSSGGAVVSVLKQEVEGIVTTVALADETKDRSLRAITLTHIDETLKNESGISVNALISSNFTATAEAFESEAGSTLREILISQFSTSN